MDGASLKRIRKKHHAWQRFMETKVGQQHQKYCRERNQVRKLTRKVKKQLEMHIAKQVKEFPKKFWSYVNSKTKTVSQIPDFVIPGTDKKTTTDLEKAEVLADYFASVFTKEPPGDIPRLVSKGLTCALEQAVVNEEVLKKKLKHLNPSKSPGPDSVSPHVLKEAADVLAKPLSLIFQTSLRSRQLPQTWKDANISAIFKKDTRPAPQIIDQ